MVCLAGVAPDVDALGLVPELLTRNTAHPLLWFSQYHHEMHTLALATCLALAAWVATRHAKVAFLVFASFHLHLLGDLVGGRGPDGDTWPMPYLEPFSRGVLLQWSGQWALNAWQNVAITAVLLYVALYLAWRDGTSPLGWVSPRADRAFVESLRRRFPRGDEAEAGSPEDLPRSD